MVVPICTVGMATDIDATPLEDCVEKSVRKTGSTIARVSAFKLENTRLKTKLNANSHLNGATNRRMRGTSCRVVYECVAEDMVYFSKRERYDAAYEEIAFTIDAAISC